MGRDIFSALYFFNFLLYNLGVRVKGVIDLTLLEVCPLKKERDMLYR